MYLRAVGIRIFSIRFDFHITKVLLVHCGLVTQYNDIDLGQRIGTKQLPEPRDLNQCRIMINEARLHLAYDFWPY